ncbi:MAG: right-handed parallel beta-helix repeat-containing protein [Acidobacteriota bacterium]
MRNATLRRIALLLLSLLWSTALSAADKTTIREFIAEPPTLVSLGFEWRIDGDDNRNATVSVSYRKKGEQAWNEGLPMLRIGNERINENAHQYVTPNGFAGSVFDLEPATDYECRFVMKDPDGTEGGSQRTVTVRTRAEPKPFAGGKVFHVYPPGHNGQKQEPAFTGLLGAYYTGSSSSDNFNTYPPRVQPGDTILVHAGLYKDDRYRYGAGLGTVSSGTYFLTQSGTPDKPIVIKGAGDGEAIFDGDGAYNLFNVMAANDNYFEGLTIRNTDLAFQGGLKNIAGSSGLTIKKCRFENVGRGIYTDWSGSKNYYIADNVMIGRFNPNILMGFTGRTWQNLPEFSPRLLSEYAVKVYGSGHVVAYNAIANFHDGVDVATYGNPDGSPNPIRDRLPVSIDFYGNDIFNMEDNCLEADGGAHNIRIFRNRCFNHGHRALSVQPAFGGPVYFIRNIVYHAPEGGAVKFTASSSGIVMYHNTLIAPIKPMLLAASNVHYRNNLVLGKSETLETFAVETNTNYSSSDYNGFRPNEGAEFSFEWSTPPLAMRANFPGEPGKLAVQQQVQLEAQARQRRRFKTLKEFSEATGQDTHSVLVDYNVFVHVAPPGPDPRTLYKPADFDFQLRPGAVAVDAGVRLPGVNDDFTGRAPDLGAYEVGRPLPHYGPRP